MPGDGHALGHLDGARWEADGDSLDLRMIDPVIVRLFGHGLERWTRRPTGWAELVVEEDRARVLAARRGTRAGRVTTLEYRIRTAAGEVVGAQERCVRDGQGALVGATFRWDDAVVPEARVAAVSVAAVAHQLNNLLTTMACHVELACQGDPSAVGWLRGAIAASADLVGRLGPRPADAGESPTTVLVVAKEVDATRPVHPRAGEGSVVIVEDEPDLRRLMGRVLAREGFKVHLASSPEAALRLLEEDGAVRLLLADLTLGAGASGEALVLRARELKPSLKVIVTSGGRSATLLDAGFLAKPFTPRHLADAVGDALAEPRRSG